MRLALIAVCSNWLKFTSGNKISYKKTKVMIKFMLVPQSNVLRRMILLKITFSKEVQMMVLQDSCIDDSMNAGTSRIHCISLDKRQHRNMYRLDQQRSWRARALQWTVCSKYPQSEMLQASCEDSCIVDMVNPIFAVIQGRHQERCWFQSQCMAQKYFRW